MKYIFTLIIAAFASCIASAQDNQFNQDLSDFNKIVVSPKIDLVLIPGNTESVRVEYVGVDRNNIIIEQKGKRLHIFLDHAKIVDIGERRHGRDMFDRRERYRAAHVTAYVTFRTLKLIETRGEGYVVCEGNILSKKLKIRAYGETMVRLAHVEAETLVARLYGGNSLKILEGEAGHLSYKMYGENKIDTRGVTSVTSNATIYGEGRMSLHSTEEVRVNSFGEPSLYVLGSPLISKGIILGNAKIRTR